MWGQHLALDVRACDRNKVTSEAILRSWVRELVDRIGMRAYGDPIVEHFASHDSSVGGYSVVQLIETSNIVGHFVDSSGDAYIDVFSCARFDRDRVIAFVHETLQPEGIIAHDLDRDAAAILSSGDRAR
jgi:S-adenosylmethionine/arginine decarboxylase-like enzyme